MRKIDCLIYHDRQEEGLEFCIFCKKKIGLSFQERLEKRIQKTPLEVKQKIIDLCWESKTIGEIKEETGLDTLLIGEIIIRNLDSFHVLSKVAKP